MPTDRGHASGPIRHKNVIVSKRLVAINSASSIAASILNATVLLWMYQFLLRRISAEEFAVYPLVSAIMVFAPLFSSAFVGGISRHVIDAYSKGDFEGVGRIVSSILPLLAGGAAVFLVAGLFFAFNIEHVFDIAPQMVGEAHIMMSLLIASFALQMVFVPFGTGYRVRQRFVELNLMGVGRDLLRIALLLILLLEIGPSVVWVVVATVVSEIAYLCVTVSRSRRMLPELRFEWRLFGMERARELVSFGMWTTLGRLGSVMYMNAALLVLNLFGTAVDVTAFHIGASFFRQLQGMVTTAAQPLLPALTAMNAMNDRARLTSAALRGGRYGLWASMIVATPLALYAVPFIHLYVGPQYASASVVIVLLMMMFPFTQATALLPMIAMATAQVRAYFLPAFLFQFAGLVLMLLFAAFSEMGAIGVALALTITTIASQLLYFWLLSLKLIGASFRKFVREVLIPGLMPAGTGLVMWLTLKLLVPPHTWFTLGLQGALGAAIYLATLLAVCLTAKEREDLRSMIARIRT